MIDDRADQIRQSNRAAEPEELVATVPHECRMELQSNAGPPREATRELPQPQCEGRVVTTLAAHRKRQVVERLAAGADWQDNDLVFCREDGGMYTSDAFNRGFRR